MGCKMQLSLTINNWCFPNPILAKGKCSIFCEIYYPELIQICAKPLGLFFLSPNEEVCVLYFLMRCVLDCLYYKEVLSRSSNATIGIILDVSKCELMRYTVVTKNHESKT